MILCGRYETVALLGRGAYGAVYLTRHIKLGVYRAIKCISKTRSTLAQVFQEVSLMNDLHHSGVPCLYDFEEDDSTYYLCMEYIRGESLQCLLQKQQTLSQEQCVQICLTLCELEEQMTQLRTGAFHYTDLKPEHIILSRDRVVLLDYGQRTEAFGVREYAAPELARGGLVDARTDVFHIGQMMRLMERYCNPIFSQITKKAISYEPENRFESVSELRMELCKLTKERHQKDKRTNPVSLISSAVILGSQNNTETTSLGIGLTCALNQKKIPTVFLENPIKPWIRQLPDFARFCQKNMDYEKKYFRGQPAYGQGVRTSTREEEFCLADRGFFQETQDWWGKELILFLVTGGEWEEKETCEILERLRKFPNCMIFCNHTRKDQLGFYARVTGQPIYEFWPQRDPFHPDRQIKRLAAEVQKRRR